MFTSGQGQWQVMSTRRGKSNELGDFLRARRAEVTPDDVGLPTIGRYRRVAGLRREEVAQLASLSTDYYTRIEPRPSDRCLRLLTGYHRPSPAPKP